MAYAVDHIAAQLEDAGASSFLVEIGGELRGRGVRGDRQPWWVRVEPPPGSPIDIRVAVCGTAIATSGDYRRWFEHKGVRYAHTIDPRTGDPLRDAPASVTVVHRRCMAADAWSTALTVLGVEQGVQVCEAMGLAAVFVLREGDNWSTVATPAFAAMLQ